MQNAVGVGLYRCTDGENHLCEIVARGRDGEPSVQLDFFDIALDYNLHVAADVRHGFLYGLTSVDVAVMRPLLQKADGACRADVVHVGADALDILDIKNAHLTSVVRERQWVVLVIFHQRFVVALYVYLKAIRFQLVAQ